MKNSDVLNSATVGAYFPKPLLRVVGITGAVLAISMSGVVFAAQGGNPGKPDDGMSPPDFGDLIIIKRDVYGVPELDENGCWQPIAFASDVCDLDDDSLQVSQCGDDTCVVTDPATCAVLEPTCTQEVDFGRINEARSPTSVFDAQLDDAVVKLATADCTSLDPAGRPVATSGDTVQTASSATIDSPLQNLAIYRELIMKGSLGVDLPGGADVLTSAARALGAASDKAGEVNVDMVVYLNQILGLSDPSTSTILDKICINMKEEVKGVVKWVEKCFLDYSSTDYFNNYDRSANFASLPYEAYIDADPGDGIPDDGVFEYLYKISTNPVTFGIARSSIESTVFDGTYSGGNVAGFAQAADDARLVIDYMHTWAVPGEEATPVPPCESTGGGGYDVYISDVSGLQVPKNIIDGSEGREFIVSVVNAGPNAADVTVTVTATALNGVEIEGSPWTYGPVTLEGGESSSWTEFFSINLGETTTINWRATANAPNDVNPANNTVTATSSVKVTGGGGGGNPNNTNSGQL